MPQRVLSTILCTDFSNVALTLSISESGDVYSLGNHNEGGHGYPEHWVFPHKVIPSLKQIVSMDIGDGHSIFLDIQGFVFTLGSNNYGQLGTGKDYKALKSTHEPQKVELPQIKQISCGGNFTMCVTTTGLVYTFGRNNNGSFGLGDIDISYSSSPLQIDVLKDIDFLTCSHYHTVAKTIYNEIFVWGSDSCGNLGIGSTEYFESKPVKCVDWPDNTIDIKCGVSHVLVLTSSQDVYSCGSNEYYELGRIVDDDHAISLQKIDNLSNVVRIECGKYHSLCIDVESRLFVFGDNFKGQLGLDENVAKVQLPVEHPTLSNVIDISSGGDHTFIKTSNNEIYSCGNNLFSQIGIQTQDDANQFVPIQVFKGNEDIWCSNITKTKAKSARFTSKRENEEDSSPPLKKQKTK